MLAYGVDKQLQVQNCTTAWCRLEATGEGDEHTTACPLGNIQPQDSLGENKQELGFA